MISWGLDQGFTAEFDLPGTRDPSAHLAAPAAIAMLQEFGMTEVQGYNHSLAWTGAQRLAERWHTQFDTPEALVGTMATVPLPAAAGQTIEDAARLRDRLFEERIEVQMHAVGGGVHVRISGQIYNTMDDVDRLAEAVLRLI